MGKRQQLSRELGTRMAAQLGWDTADYTAAELTALGEQLVADLTLHGDEASGAQLLVAVAKAASALDEQALASGDHDKIAQQITEFLAAEFKDEFAVSHAAANLAALRMPNRPDLARELLRHIGLDADRRVDTPVLVDPDNLLASNDRKTAADYYFNYDKLSAGDIRNMSDRSLSDAEIALKLASLPGSLDAEFSRRFDAYTSTAAKETVKLVDSWLSWITTKLGVDLGNARIEVSAARLQYYRREVQSLRGAAFVYDGRTQSEVPAAGYFATIHAAGRQYRYFLSTLDGAAYPLPADAPAPDWASRHPRTVFGVPHGDADPGGRARSGLLSRVVLDGLGQGKRNELDKWLIPAVRGHLDKARATARAQTPAEQSIDTLLDFIPFRRMVVAIRAGDIETALMSGSMDVLTFAIPMLCSGLRLAAGASRGLVPAVRAVGRGLATGIGEIRAALAELPGLRAGIKAALESMNATADTARDLRPLDADAMARNLASRHPRLAYHLEQSAARARGLPVRDGWWRVMGRPAAGADDTGIATLERVTARSRDDRTLPLLPYGDDSGRAYTRVDPSTGQRRGSVLLADSEGWLYQSLPADTLGRYRVSAPDILRALGARRAGADGAIAFNGKTYARIADDYVEITPEHASTVTRPAWRVVAPRGATRDIVTYRLFHDKERVLWRRADVPELKGGGITWGSQEPSSSRPSSSQPPLQPSDQRSAPPPSEPSSAPSSQSSSSQSAPTQSASSQSASSQEASPQSASSQSAFSEPTSSQSTSSRPRSSQPPTRKRPLTTDTSVQTGEEPTPKRVAEEHTPAASGKPALPPIGPSARQLSKYRELLLRRIRGTPSAAQIDAVRDLLLKAEASPRGRAILRAMQAHQEFLGEAPEIVLLDEGNRALPRPRLERYVPSTVWHLDPNGLSADSVARELAAVYNNMTGILYGMDPVAVVLEHGGPPLPSDIEEALTRWVGVDQGHYEFTDRRVFVPSTRQVAADRLRDQLREAQCHGGLDAATLRNVLKGRLRGEIGLKVDLSRLQLTEIPPLPADVRTLNIAHNPITDWRAMPGSVRVLDATSTNKSVLKHLPEDLVDLDVSANQLETLPAELLPRRLKHLHANHNLLSNLPEFPGSLVELSVSGNRLRALPKNFPPTLRTLDASSNALETFPANLPDGLTDLKLSDNNLGEIPAEHVPPRLRTLDLDENTDLDALPEFPDTLKTLHVESTGLTALPTNLPRGLTELYAADLGLTSLPNDLPPGLRVLGLSNNQLSALPPGIIDLTMCEIFLEGNLISPQDLPPAHPGAFGPIFHLPGLAQPGAGNQSRTIGEAVRRWLDEDAGEAAQRWDAIAGELEGPAADATITAEFRRFLDKLRDTVHYHDEILRADMRELLEELSRPERKEMLKSALRICGDVAASCHDGLAWGMTELKELRVHDDIVLGLYKGRAADALNAMRQLFRSRKLREIANRKIAELVRVDPGFHEDIEVYLGFAVKLRDKLGLSMVLPDMIFFNESRITTRELEAALHEVQQVERAEFYKDLVVQETWRQQLKWELSEDYAKAAARRDALAGDPLKKKVREKLEELGLDPSDADAEANISPAVWRDMEYDLLEPLTHKYLTSQGLPMPDGAPG